MTRRLHSISFSSFIKTLRPEEENFEREIDITLGPEFATVVTYLDMLPTWLFEIVLACMQQRLEKQRKDEGVYIRFRNSLLKDCLTRLRMQSASIIDTCPDIAVDGSLRMDFSATSPRLSR